MYMLFLQSADIDKFIASICLYIFIHLSTTGQSYERTQVLNQNTAIKLKVT